MDTSPANKQSRGGKFSPQWIMLYILLAVIAGALCFMAYNSWATNKAMNGPDVEPTKFNFEGQSAQSVNNTTAAVPDHTGSYWSGIQTISLHPDGTFCYNSGELSGYTLVCSEQYKIVENRVTFTEPSSPVGGHQFELRNDNTDLYDLVTGVTWSKR